MVEADGCGGTSDQPHGNDCGPATGHDSVLSTRHYVGKDAFHRVPLFYTRVVRMRSTASLTSPFDPAPRNGQRGISQRFGRPMRCRWWLMSHQGTSGTRWN